VGVAVSIGTAYFGDAIAKHHGLRPGALQLLHCASCFGTVLLGMLWKRATPAGGFWGLLAGTTSSVGMWAWVKVSPGAVKYVALSPQAQDQAQNMFRALWCWLICVVVTVVVSLITKPRPDAELTGLVYGLTAFRTRSRFRFSGGRFFWAVIVGIVFVILNIVFW